MGRVPPLGSARFPWLATRAPQDSDFSGLELAGRFDGCIQQRDKVDHPIRDRSQDHDSDFMALEILLVLEILIGGDKDIEVRGGTAEQFPVLQAHPTAIKYGLDSHAAEVRGQRARKGLIKKDSHPLPALPGRVEALS